MAQGRGLIPAEFGPIGDEMVARSRRSVVAAATTVVFLIAGVSYAAIGRSGAAVDTDAPVLASLAISPTSVDTSSGPAVITITARLTDEQSPSIGGSVPLSRVILTGPSGQQQAIAYLSQAQRVSGTPADGIYTSTLTMPWHAQQGQWGASAVLVDISDNTRTMSTSDLVAAGFPSVVTQTGAGDTAPPQLVALGIAPASVDTSLEPATITVSAHIVDDLSGVSDGVAKAASQVVLQGPSGAHQARATLSIDHRTAGTALDATFVVAIVLPRWSEQGLWTVQGVTVVDQVGNQQTVTAPGVTFMQTGIGDTAPPQFRSFVISASTVDVETSSATIAMLAHIVDDLSGAADGLTDSPSSVVFASPSGFQRITVPFGISQRVSGTAIDGNYAMSATIPAHAEPGLWTMTDAWPIDQAGNVGHLSAADWSAVGYPGSFTVISDTPPNTGPTLPTTPTTTPSPTTGSVFTTTTSIDPNSTTTSFDPNSTTTSFDPNSTTTTFDPGSTTTTSSDPNSTTTTFDPGSTTSTSVGTGVPTTTTSTTLPVESGSDGPPLRHANGYWFVTSTGRVAGFGAAGASSLAAAGIGANDRVVGIAASPSGLGYWLATANGDVRPFGDAHSYGSMAGRPLARPIVGIATTPSGHGYWLVATDGGIFGFGDARFYGSTGAIHLNQPIVGMTSTPSGHGYWFVAADGGLFSYGDAHFFGSMGATHLNQPVVGMTASSGGHGYWMVARDGGIFSFGDTRFFGSTGAIRLNQPIVGMAISPTGGGYWFVAADGGVFSFGDARFFGSLAGSPAPVVGMAVRAA
jgi:hypothetical protein